MAKKEKKKDGILDIADVRGKTADELNDMLLDAKKEQFNLRFQQKTGELQSPARIRYVRRNIAKIKTVLNEVSNNNKKEAANA